jgi:hypothetical protein
MICCLHARCAFPVSSRRRSAEGTTSRGQSGNCSRLECWRKRAAGPRVCGGHDAESGSVPPARRESAPALFSLLVPAQQKLQLVALWRERSRLHGRNEAIERRHSALVDRLCRAGVWAPPARACGRRRGRSRQGSAHTRASGNCSKRSGCTFSISFRSYAAWKWASGTRPTGESAIDRGRRAHLSLQLREVLGGLRLSRTAEVAAARSAAQRKL